MKKRLLQSLLLSVTCLTLSLAAGIASAAEADKYVWRFQAVHSPNQLVYHLFQKTVDEIYEASGGRMKIELYPGGALAGSMEAFQACGDGVFEMHSSFPTYLKGIEPAIEPMVGANMTMSDTDRMIWLNEAGGNQLLQKVFDKVNLRLMATQMWPSDVLASSKPFKSFAEMKGSKFRTSSPTIATANGISVVTLPLEEVFTAIASGAVDMAEFGYLEYNRGLGITDVARYNIWPDFWNGQFVETIVVNKDAWNKLPKDLQMLVEHAFKANALEHWTKALYSSAKAMREMKASGKNEFIRLDKQEFIALRKQMYGIEKEQAAKRNGLLQETYNSMYDFFRVYYPYKVTAAWWGDGLSADEQAGFSLGK